MSAGWRVEGLETRLGSFHLGPVDLAVPAGGAVAILGGSGAGKTTLLRTLAGFLRPSAGRILHNGVDVSRWLPEERGLGYVPQGLGLFPHRTAAGNVRYPLEVRGRADAAARTSELLERFRLTGLADRYPARLSGGEQQRVAIARALAADPTLIVFDEPWQGLDVVARHELGEVLHEVRSTEGVPIVVVTHDPALAFSLADRFLVLRAGRPRGPWDAATLLRSPTDPFSARFVGFENVFEPAALLGGSPGGLRSWLQRLGGSEGVAFPTPALPGGPSDGAPWEGRVRSARPTPQGIAIEAITDELIVTLRVPAPVTAPFPGLGDLVRFHLPSGDVVPLGDRAEPPVG